MEKIIQMNKYFAEDVLKGLSSKQKFLPSKYFYDEKGDELFQAIMNLDEYYLTRSEYQIFEKDKNDLASSFSSGRQPFNIIELGAGDGYKTKVLLKHFLEQKLNFRYIPIDISSNILEDLKDDLHKNFEDLIVHPYQGDYFEALNELNHQEDTRKIVFFLGSNIGNFKDLNEVDFFRELANYLKNDDKVFVGFDMVKDPKAILDAYNDKSGITKAFNLNLLYRINKELGGDFNLDSFMHYPIYDPGTGQAKSYLVSTEEQKVYIDALNRSFSFRRWEAIFMEVSKKYRLSEIENIAFSSGFKIEQNFFDNNRYFVDSLWTLNR